MQQVIPKAAFNALYGASTEYIGLLNGDGDISDSSTFGPNYGRVVCAAAGTFRNLVVYSKAAGKPAYTVTLQKNGVDTGLTCTLGASNTFASDAVHSVTVSTGDDIQLKVGGAMAGIGFPLAFCLTFEGDQSIYGISTGVITGDRHGGAFGNGFFRDFDRVLPRHSNTYSITATPGTVTTLTLKSFTTGPGSSTFTGYLYVNEVLQDGSPGTVNTACALSGSNLTATSTFTLPVALGDHVDVVILQTSGTDPLLLSAGVAFTATTADRYMLCGGDNSVVGSWRWTDSDQLVTPESANQAPVNDTGFYVHGLYIERGEAPADNGSSATHTVRRNSADTGIAATLVHPNTSASDQGHTAAFRALDLIDIGITTSGETGGLGELHWGLAASVSTPTPTTTTYPMRCVRRFMLPFDQNYNIFISRLEIIMQTGVGLSSGQGSDPVVMLRMSWDGGATWGNERQLSIGKIGEYFRRVYTTRVGKGRMPVAEIACSDPVFLSLLDCTVDAEKGLS